MTVVMEFEKSYRYPLVGSALVFTFSENIHSYLNEFIDIGNENIIYRLDYRGLLTEEQARKIHSRSHPAVKMVGIVRDVGVFAKGADIPPMMSTFRVEIRVRVTKFSIVGDNSNGRD